jgi:hypothetical protein
MSKMNYGLIAIINLLSLWALGVVIWVHMQDIKVMDYTWTHTRSTGIMHDAVYNEYLKNTLVGPSSALDELRDRVYSHAGCATVKYEGVMTWSPEMQSPLCNCLYNEHLVYVHSISGMTNQQLLANVPNRTVAAEDIRSKCFRVTRPTQMSFVHERNAGYTVNPAMLILLWNSAAFLCTCFFWWQSATPSEKDHASEKKEKENAFTPPVVRRVAMSLEW